MFRTLLRVRGGVPVAGTAKRVVSLVVVAVMAVSAHALLIAQQGGLNTPVLPGLPADPADPLAMYKSDVLEQHQLEPDIVELPSRVIQFLSARIRAHGFE